MKSFNIKLLFLAILPCTALYAQVTNPVPQPVNADPTTQQCRVTSSTILKQYGGVIYSCQGTLNTTGAYAVLPGGSGGTITQVSAGTGLSGGGSTGSVQVTLSPAAIGIIGGVQAIAGISHQWVSSINTSGLPILSQPSASDISGLGPYATTPTVTGDGTLNAGTGALAVSKIAGQAPGNLYPQNAPAAAPCLSTVGAQITNSGCAVLAVPAPAAAAGYNTCTFCSTLPVGEFDQAQSYASGFKWYYSNLSVVTPAPASTMSFFQDYAVINGAASSISTAGRTGAFGSGTWVGTAFGGGAYIEASVAFDPINSQAAGPSGNWPSVWSASIEAQPATPPLDPWLGFANANYTNSIELDAMEYDQWTASYSRTNWYGATAHNHYGIFGATCAGFCDTTNSATQIAPPAPVDFTSYHTYGMLWVPATGTPQRVGGAITYVSGGTVTGTGTCIATDPTGNAAGFLSAASGTISGTLTVTTPGSGYSSIPTSWTLASGTTTCSGTAITSGGTVTDGYVTFYFDGQPTVSSVSWVKFIGSPTQPPPPAYQTVPYTYGVLDTQHLYVLLSTGLNQPMSIRYVSVWQANATNNITH